MKTGSPSSSRRTAAPQWPACRLGAAAAASMKARGWAQGSRTSSSTCFSRAPIPARRVRSPAKCRTVAATSMPTPRSTGRFIGSMSRPRVRPRPSRSSPTPFKTPHCQKRNMPRNRRSSAANSRWGSTTRTAKARNSCWRPCFPKAPTGIPSSATSMFTTSSPARMS